MPFKVKNKKLIFFNKNCICKEKNGHDSNALCWSFCTVNDNNIVDGSNLRS
jgi:hypothetical protein